MPNREVDLESAFARFLADEIDAAGRVAGYSGSLDQFYVQQAFVDEVEPSVTLVRGARSSWDPAVIQLRVPEAATSAEAAKSSAVTLLHELLHQRYTGVTGLGAAFRSVLTFGQTAGPDAQAVADASFQWLEDARVSIRAASDYPSLEQYLHEFDQAVLDEFERAYREQFSQEPWTETPVSPEKQLLGALVFRIFARGRPAPAMKASVAAIIVDADEFIDRALCGSVTDVAASAIAIAKIYTSSSPL